MGQERQPVCFGKDGEHSHTMQKVRKKQSEPQNSKNYKGAQIDQPKISYQPESFRTHNMHVLYIESRPMSYANQARVARVSAEWKNKTVTPSPYPHHPNPSQLACVCGRFYFDDLMRFRK